MQAELTAGTIPLVPDAQLDRYWVGTAMVAALGRNRGRKSEQKLKASGSSSRALTHESWVQLGAYHVVVGDGMLNVSISGSVGLGAREVVVLEQPFGSPRDGHLPLISATFFFRDRGTISLPQFFRGAK